MINSYSKEVL